MMQAVVYLHGFNSSANALKAQETQHFLLQYYPSINFYSPTIPDLPDEAKHFLNAFILDLKTRYDALLLIGSSLGGFYATWLAEAFDIKAVLVNPAIRPHELMRQYLGWNENPYSHHRYELTVKHIKTLQSLYITQMKDFSRFLVLLQMGDEVLQASEASKRFYRSTCRIMPGGNHRFEHFETQLPAIASWATFK